LETTNGSLVRKAAVFVCPARRVRNICATSAQRPCDIDATQTQPFFA